MAEKETFGGAGKVGESFFTAPEKRLVARFAGSIPSWLETYHLTLLTLVWSALILVFGWMARSSIHWLWMVSVMVVLQYITDLFDGAVGRMRNTGLVRWGFFMDHFLDYVFLCSLMIAYYLVAPHGHALWFMLLLALTGAHMTHSFLAFASTNEFRIAFHGVGPTEMRLAFIVINAFIIFTWPAFYEFTLPLLTLVVLLGLIWVVYHTQKRLWSIDMQARNDSSGTTSESLPSAPQA